MSMVLVIKINYVHWQKLFFFIEFHTKTVIFSDLSNSSMLFSFQKSQNFLKYYFIIIILVQNLIFNQIWMFEDKI